MSQQFFCANQSRRDDVLASTKVNGIDYIEVSADQKTIDVHFFHPLPGHAGGIPSAPALHAKDFLITGGLRIADVKIISITTSATVAHLHVNHPGDFSWYSLTLVPPALPASATGVFDPVLTEVQFSFKVNCPSDVDCETVIDCPPEEFVEPDIDYLVKDYAGFRRLMLDRMSVRMPDWRERNPADVQVTLVELLAYVGDYLSYYQDAVGTEAYLGTARKRISVRRHARLLDYFMHDGCNARVWLQLQAAVDGAVPAHAQFFTPANTAADGGSADQEIFESMHDVNVFVAHNTINFYTWGNQNCCLPNGATEATLLDTPTTSLAVGDLLLFEEINSPTNDSSATLDTSHRQVVRLTSVEKTTDPLYTIPVVNIAWGSDDALTFPLCISALKTDIHDVTTETIISVARGNVVLADHGATVPAAQQDVVTNSPDDPTALKYFPLTQQGCVRNEYDQLVLDVNGQPKRFDETASAISATQWQTSDALPAITLLDASAQVWSAVRDLLSSDEFSRDFVVEIDERGKTFLRFGDGVLGELPAGSLTAQYRVGSGIAGNVGAETITQFDPSLSAIISVRNPMPAFGGVDPESMEEVRQFAPQAFRVQERAVTEADWAEVAQRHPEVQKAAATFRWTGSWRTVFVTIDRIGGLPVDENFIDEMLAFLERFRIAGYDLAVNAPVFVPLDIIFSVCVQPGYLQTQVRTALFAAFRKFFDPDNFTFGQPVYLSRLYRTAMDIAGVASVVVTKFQRYGKNANGEIDAGMLKPAPMEIIELSNDPNFPEQGTIDFVMKGGL